MFHLYAFLIDTYEIPLSQISKFLMHSALIKTRRQNTTPEASNIYCNGLNWVCTHTLMCGTMLSHFQHTQTALIHPANQAALLYLQATSHVTAAKAPPLPPFPTYCSPSAVPLSAGFPPSLSHKRSNGFGCTLYPRVLRVTESRCLPCIGVI